MWLIVYLLNAKENTYIVYYFNWCVVKEKYGQLLFNKRHNSDAFFTCNAMWVKLLMLFCSYKKSG